MKSCKKIVLAYSGGLDTTTAIPWLKEQTGAEIVALAIDVGQADNFEEALKRALHAGVVQAEVLDAKEEYAQDFLLPAIQANALYEGVYPLLSALSRPLIVEKLVQAAAQIGADAVAHGCTGKGNDQLRFELSLAALAPHLTVLAPARHWGMTREDAFAYAQGKGLNLALKPGTLYSIDENLWGRAIECGPLEDPWTEPPADAFALTAEAAQAPDAAVELTIDFEQGVPTALNGTPMPPLDLIAEVSVCAGAHGVGRIDHMENRTVGIKSREVYECPAGVALIQAHKALESLVLTKDEARFKAQVETRWAELVYEGKWHAPLKQSLDAFISATQATVTGSVRLKLYKGTLQVVGRRSPYALYDTNLTTYGDGDTFDHTAADGYLKLAAMELATLARVHAGQSALTQETHDDRTVVAQPVS